MNEFFKNSFPYFKKYIPIHIFATLCGLTRIFILLATTQLASMLVDYVINPLLGAESVHNSSIFNFLIRGIPADDYLAIFWLIAGAMVVCALLFFVGFYLKWNLAHYFSLKSQKRMRMDALNKINASSAPLLNRYTAGDLILVTTKDPGNICDMYIATSQFMLDNIVFIVFSGIFLCQIHWSLIFLPVAGGIACMLVIICFQKRFGKLYDNIWKSNSALSTTVQESVYGIRTVAAFAKEEHRRELFGRDNRRLFDTNIGGVKLYALRNMLTWIVRAFVIGGEVALGIYLGTNGKLTAGEFTAMIGYLGSLMWQITGLLYNINGMQNNIVSAKRFFGFLNDRDETAEKYGTSKVSEHPSIELKNVYVKNGDSYALENFSVTLPYGKKLGIMGKTGSGKTLVCKLMQGFAEADKGEILIDGRSIYDYGREDLARAYSYAMQNVFLFSNTIAANIALYNPYGGTESVLRAGRLAEVDEFACRFPEGYDTTIGEKGFGLSGGQKQRISIARSLYKNAQVLVFDDVTSALDLDTERRVFKNLQSECAEKTLVFVTHRAPALKNCDEILFLDEGKVIERGTFDELIALGGNFAEVYNRQEREVSYEE